MSLSDNYAPIKTLGNGVTTVFSFSWQGISTDFVKVYSQNVITGVISELTTGFTKALDATGIGGTITFITAPASTVYIIIARVTPKAQTDPYRTSSGFQAAVIESNFDKIVAMQQEAASTILRALSFPLGTDLTALGISAEFPLPSSLKSLRWNSGATALENYTPTATDLDYSGAIAYGADASKAASPSSGDIYFATDTQIDYRCYAAGVWEELKVSAVSFRVSKTAHGFSVGDVLRHNGTDFTKAQADSDSHAQAVGIVSAVISANLYTLTVSGKVTGLTGLTAGSQYYLSAATAGLLTATKPSGLVKPVLIAYSTTAGVFINQVGAAEEHYRDGLAVHWESGTDTICVEAGACKLNGALVSKADRTTLAIGTAGNYAGGSSLRAVSTNFFVGIDASGNIKIHTTAPAYSDYGVSVATGKLRYATWSSTVYRILGWFRTNATGSGEITNERSSNLPEFGLRNKIYISSTSTFTGTPTFPVDNTIVQESESLNVLAGGIYLFSAKSKVRVNAKVCVDNSTGGNGAGEASAIFRTTVGNGALDVAGGREGAGAGGAAVSDTLKHLYEELVGANTAWNDFKLGVGFAGATVVAGQTLTANFGNKVGSTMALEEVDA